MIKGMGKQGVAENQPPNFIFFTLPNIIIFLFFRLDEKNMAQNCPQGNFGILLF